jgi:hypothetical protein
MTYKKSQKIANNNNNTIISSQSNNINEINAHDIDKILTNDLQKSQKIAKEKYFCEKCNYNTFNKFDFLKHTKTQKHIFNINNNTIIIDEKKFNCECGKQYKHRQSLCNHKKNCNKLIEKTQNENLLNSIVEKLTNQEEQNKTMQNTLNELIPKMEMVQYNNNNVLNQNITNNVNNVNNVTNTINQNLNINIFLNENCKDAMNIGDFVKKIEVSISDLLLSKEKGLTEGISNLIIKHLNQIPLTERPLWCSDKKKKKLHIKDDCWKDDIDNVETNKIIDDVSKIQCKNINKFIENKPNWIENEKIKDTYLGIVKQATEPVDDKKNKIINKLIDTIYLNPEKIKN